MPFTWISCLDGSSVDLVKADAFTVGQVQKHTDDGQPLFEDEKPIMIMCVFTRIGNHDYPIRIVSSMNEAQLTIQSILASLKSAYDKERGVIQVATHEEKSSLKLR